MAYTSLSDLQQLILALATFHRLNAHRDEGIHPDVYGHEVLAVRWGFPTKDGTRLQLWEKRTPQRPQLPKARLGKRYQAARVAVSKAFRRLEQRGLVKRSYTCDATGQRSLGLTLTPVGIPLANQALGRFGQQWQALYQRVMAKG